MRKILFFYSDKCSKSLAVKQSLVDNYGETHILRLVEKKSGTSSYSLKHNIRKLPTIILLNESDRELRREVNITVENLNTFI